MQKKYLLISVLLLPAIILLSCKNDKPKEQKIVENNNDSLIFYPVNQYIRNQITTMLCMMPSLPKLILTSH